jgi:hypothetical protein
MVVSFRKRLPVLYCIAVVGKTSIGIDSLLKSMLQPGLANEISQKSIVSGIRFHYLAFLLPWVRSRYRSPRADCKFVPIANTVLVDRPRPPGRRYLHINATMTYLPNVMNKMTMGFLWTQAYRVSLCDSFADQVVSKMVRTSHQSFQLCSCKTNWHKQALSGTKRTAKTVLSMCL